MLARDGSLASTPPANNMGGNIADGLAVSVDWLSGTWAFADLHPLELAGRMADWFGSAVHLDVLTQGFCGFAIRGNLRVLVDNDWLVVGLMAWGGNSQAGRAFFSLTGRGCALVPEGCWPMVRADLELYGVKITRVDLAADDIEGVYSVDCAADWYKAGVFNAGGRCPSHEVMGSWLVPDGRGRTLYVGRAENGKALCVYEKGKQLGDCDSPWVRWELRLLAKDRVIPYDVLTAREAYFAGGYKCLSQIVQAAAARIRTVQAVVEKTLEKLVTHARRSYGKLFGCMLRESGGDYVDLVSRVVVRGIPASLQAAWIHRAGVS